MTRVITYGVFDLFHQGHINLLKHAKELGDELIVGITTDQYAYERGKLTVVDSLETRMENVRKCPYADEVIVEDHIGQKVEDILKYNIDIFAIGDDWFGKFDYLEAYCKVVYLPRTAGISSSILRLEKYPYLRMGIIGAGRIAQRFVKEAGYVREIQITSVYHPNPDTSASLARFLGQNTAIAKVRTLPKLFDNCDAVYIASPHDTHYAYAKAALEAGRHVLCEKPLALHKKDAVELFRLASEKGLVLMEGIKTAYCPGFCRMISLARSGVIGEIHDVEASFTRLTPPGVREWTDLKAGGSFTELGSYVLLPVMKLLGTDNLTWRFESVLNADGLDTYTRVYLRRQDMLAEGKCGLGVKSEGELIISGTKGYILAEAPWWKTQYYEVRGENPAYRQRYSAEYAEDGLRYEIADFMYRVQGHTGREDKLTPAESAKMAEIMEDFLAGRNKG